MTVTLATLPEATAQEVFDHVARHLHAQGEPSIKPDGLCLYRLGALRCAAGCLIADTEYSMDFEALKWGELVESSLVPGAHEDLITALQECHDEWEPDEWPARLRDLAGLHRLSPVVVDELWPS